VSIQSSAGMLLPSVAPTFDRPRARPIAGMCCVEIAIGHSVIEAAVRLMERVEVAREHGDGWDQMKLIVTDLE
jgi:hypothetical protein